jgi:hypothetical protein
MRSITPKSYRDYTSTTNTSWFGTYNINQWLLIFMLT